MKLITNVFLKITSDKKLVHYNIHYKYQLKDDNIKEKFLNL